MAALPAADTREAFLAICRDEAALRPGVEQLCRLLGVNTVGLSRFPAGSLPVYAVGNLVLKLFPRRQPVPPPGDVHLRVYTQPA